MNPTDDLKRVERIRLDEPMAAPAPVEPVIPQENEERVDEITYLGNVRKMLGAKSILLRAFYMTVFVGMAGMLVVLVMKLMSPAALDAAKIDGAAAIDDVLNTK